jgi:demethylmenaquinone methyltransferase/2-methoxy-6-polyprenyl-1,4-benzoquinol methylase
MAPAVADSANYFDRLAATGIWQEFTAEEQGRLAEHARHWDVQPGQTVLEPGCGAGRLTAVLAGLVGPGGRVIACDPAQAMIARVAARGLPPQVVLRAQPVELLDLPAESLDRVICFHIWPHVTDPAGTLRVLRAAMRPGACLWISHLKSREAINHIHANGPPEIRHHLLPTLAELAEQLAEAGLQVIDRYDRNDGFRIGAILISRCRRRAPWHGAPLGLGGW